MAKPVILIKSRREIGLKLFIEAYLNRFHLIVTPVVFTVEYLPESYNPGAIAGITQMNDLKGSKAFTLYITPFLH